MVFDDGFDDDFLDDEQFPIYFDYFLEINKIKLAFYLLGDLLIKTGDQMILGILERHLGHVWQPES